MERRRELVLVHGILLFLFHNIHVAHSQSELTTKEKDAIIKFRQIGANTIGGDSFRNSDEYIIRFLKSSNMDANVANQKMQQYLKFRKENKLDEILTEDFADLRKWCNFQVQGRDKEGRPILYWPFGNCELRRIVLAGKQDRLARYLQYLIESVGVVVRSSKTTEGRQVAEAMGIMDLNGFSLRQQACLGCLPFYTYLIKTLDTNYPRALKSFNIINTPKVFHNIFDRVIVVAAPSTQQVVRVYGYDKEEWKRELVKIISVDQLPMLFRNGTRT